MKRLYQKFASVTCVAIAALLCFTLYMQVTLPDDFYVVEGEPFSIRAGRYITAMEPAEGLPAHAYDQSGNSYHLDLKMFGAIGIKQVNVQVVERNYVIPGGNPFGLKMFTEGVMVVGLSDINLDGQAVNPAKEAGIATGDIILSIGGRKVSSNEDVAAAVSGSQGEAVAVELRRKNTRMKVSLKPVKSPDDGSYKAGIWVRDSSAGIGTMTYYNPTSMAYGGLGHAICDVDTGELMPLSSGEIVGVTITGVGKGVSGKPGELRGSFNGSGRMGSLEMNNETGVFGLLERIPVSGEAIPLAVRHEVQTGPAEIRTTLSGDKPQDYSIVIEKINFSDSNPTKNMVIRVTDPTLLEKTGGIVQGMSGSPIIQNGRLVGAVTHVFVNDPTRGYAIFAENMEKSSKIVESGSRKVS